MEHYPTLFTFKKWTLILLCGIYILFEILIAVLAGKIADAWIEKDQNIGHHRYVDDIQYDRVKERGRESY